MDPAIRLMSILSPCQISPNIKPDTLKNTPIPTINNTMKIRTDILNISLILLIIIITPVLRSKITVYTTINDRLCNFRIEHCIVFCCTILILVFEVIVCIMDRPLFILIACVDDWLEVFEVT